MMTVARADVKAGLGEVAFRALIVLGEEVVRDDELVDGMTR